jgi:hypothetical protein
MVVMVESRPVKEEGGCQLHREDLSTLPLALAH